VFPASTSSSVPPLSRSVPPTVVSESPAASSLPPEAAAPDVPADLRPFAPAAPRWQDIGPGLLLDEASATVYFTHMSG
jgi:hypothetical protein